MESEEGGASSSSMALALQGEPLVSFSTPGSSANEFMQLLLALQLQEKRENWPLLSALKVKVQHCDKCSREYCSPINYRRHIHAFHRPKASDQESGNMRDLIAEFWTAKSIEDAKELVSFEDVKLEEVPGSSIIKALTALVRKAGFSSLPELYLKAGSQLLDVIQARQSKFPVSFEELFTAFDYASENTFLCGQVGPMQRYILDGDSGKIGLEAKNVIACSSFLLEQKLIDAWRTQREAESLRFQSLLLEEEEASRKRQADDLEKNKKKKKLKKKDQKEKAQRSDEKEVDDETIENASEKIPSVETATPEEIPSAETAAPAASDPQTDDAVDTPTDQPFPAGEDFDPAAWYYDWEMPPVDEAPFIPVGSRKGRQKLLRDSQSAESSSSHAAKDSQASKLVIDSQSPKSISRRKSIAKDSQPAQSPKASSTSKSVGAQGFQASKSSDARTFSAKKQGSAAQISSSVPKSLKVQDSLEAISPRKSPVAQGSWAPKSDASAAAQGSKAKSSISVPKSHETQKSQASVLPGSSESRSAEVKEHEEVGLPSKSWADMVKEEEEEELSQFKEQEVTPKPIFEQESWPALGESKTAKEPSQPKEQVVSPSATSEPDDQARKKQQEPTLASDRPNEADQTEQQDNPDVDKLPEGCGTPPKEEGQTSENRVQDEPEESSDPVQSDSARPAVQYWIETFVPNGSRETNIDFKSMNGNLFESMDWDAAIQIAEALNRQRWREAIAGEHVTLVLEPFIDDSPEVN